MTWVSHSRRSFIRAGVVLLLALAAGAVVQRPAAAMTCKDYDPVFGVTVSGVLVEHDYCHDTDVTGFLPAREIAGGDWRAFRSILWGGQAADGAATIYAVRPTGQLYWFRQHEPGNALGPGRQVGQGVADWARYRSMFATGDGVLYGIDDSGTLLRWEHAGWRDGSDRWAGPQVAGTGFARVTRLVDSGRLLERAPSVFIATSTAPRGFELWTSGGLLLGLRSVLPDGVSLDSVTAAPRMHRIYGLAAGRGLVQLAAEGCAEPGLGKPRWGIKDATPANYVRVIAGRAANPGQAPGPGQGPYEWQCHS